MDQQIGKATIFVGGPFSAALKFNEASEIVGFDEVLRGKFDDVHSWLTGAGFGVLSSHIAESYGALVHETTLVQRDNTWLRVCDAYLALLPFDQRCGQPYRTDGTFVEIGLAIALGKPCILLVESPLSSAWSYYVRNLGAEPFVWIVPYESGRTEWEKVRTAALCTEIPHMGLPVHVAEADVLNSLVSGASLGHINTVGSFDVQLTANVFSSRYDATLRWALGELSKVPASHGRYIGVVAADGGELAVSVAGFPEVQILQVTLSKAAQASVEHNIRTAGLQNVRASMNVDIPARPLDALFVHLPPRSSSKPLFKTVFEKSIVAAKRLSRHLVPGAPVFFMVGNQTAWQFAETNLNRYFTAFGRIDIGELGAIVLKANARR